MHWTSQVQVTNLPTLGVTIAKVRAEWYHVIVGPVSMIQGEKNKYEVMLLENLPAILGIGSLQKPFQFINQVPLYELFALSTLKDDVIVIDNFLWALLPFLLRLGI